MQILQRYFWREMALNTAGVVGALAAILLIYDLGAVLGRAAQMQYPRTVVLRLFALGVAEHISILMPLGLLLGIVLALGRVYFDGEMVAAQACGFSRVRVYWPALGVAIPVALLSAWLNLQFAPLAASRRATLTAEAVRSGLAVPFEAGRFRPFDDGRTVVYAHSADANGALHEVFIKQTLQSGIAATVAQRAVREVASDGLSQTIRLLDGERLEGVPGSQQFRRLRFAELRIPLAAPEAAVRHEQLDEVPTARLWRSDAPNGAMRAARAELQWRLSLPLMVLVVTACAVPLSRLRPRQGRYAKVWMAVLLFAAYGNLATAARTWFEHEVTPPQLGLWWVHGLFILLALWLNFGRARMAR